MYLPDPTAIAKLAGASSLGHLLLGKRVDGPAGNGRHLTALKELLGDRPVSLRRVRDLMGAVGAHWHVRLDVESAIEGADTDKVQGSVAQAYLVLSEYVALCWPRTAAHLHGMSRENEEAVKQMTDRIRHAVGNRPLRADDLTKALEYFNVLMLTGALAVESGPRDNTNLDMVWAVDENGPQPRKSVGNWLRRQRKRCSSGNEFKTLLLGHALDDRETRRHLAGEQVPTFAYCERILHHFGDSGEVLARRRFGLILCMLTARSAHELSKTIGEQAADRLVMGVCAQLAAPPRPPQMPQGR